MSGRPILVVGAGPVGLALAGELRHGGVPVRIVDRLAEPSRLSKAVAVHARTLELLAASGLADRFLAQSVRATGARLTAAGKTLAEIGFEHVDSRFPFALCLPQDVTESLLHELLVERGGAVERGVELAGLSQDEDGVTATFRSADGRATTDRFSYAVGCDGGHSTVRGLVGTRLEGSFDGETFLLVDCDAEHALERDLIHLVFHREGLFALFPLRGERVRLVIQIAQEPGAAAPTLDDAQRLGDERTGGALALRNARWVTCFRIHEAQVPRYRIGRVFLAGDAAHVHSPAGGQGMNTGIQDAYNLAWKLRLAWAGAAAPGLLDSYHAERHPVGAQVIRNASRLTKALAHGGALARHARELVVSTLVGHTPLRDRLAVQLSETAIAYHHSPIVSGLARRTEGHGPLRPGDVAPVLGTLAGAIDPAVHTVLVFGAGEAPAAARLRANFGPQVEIVRVDDSDGAIGARYGAGEGLLAIVRPDGHLAYLGEPDDVAQAERALARAIG